MQLQELLYILVSKQQKLAVLPLSSGFLFIKAGVSLNSSFTPVIAPETGVMTSEAALTLSTVPTGSLSRINIYIPYSNYLFTDTLYRSPGVSVLQALIFVKSNSKSVKSKSVEF